MGIVEAFRLIPDGVFLFRAVIPYFHNRGGSIDTFPFQEYRNQKLSEAIGSAFDLGLFPGLYRVKDDHIFFFVKSFVGQTDQIRADLAGLLIVNPVDSFVARIGDLLRIFRQFYLGHKLTGFILDGSQFVDAAERRAVFGSDQVCANTPRGNGSTLILQAVDQMFIQITGSRYGRVRISGIIQHFSRFLGHISQVAAVQTDAVIFQRNACLFHLIKDADSVGHAGTQGVVGIYQKNTGIGIELRISLKSSILIWEAHDPTVSVSTHHRNLKKLSGQYIGRAYTAADHGSPGAVNTGVRSLGAAQTKLHDPVALRRIYYAGGFRGDQALVINDGQERRLHQLCFHNRSDHLYQRLSRKYHGSFRNGIDVAAEMKASQIIQKIFVKNAQTLQIRNILIGKFEIFNIVNCLFQSCCNGVASVAGIFSVKNIKYHFLLCVALKVTLHHGQFIKIRHQGKVHSTHRVSLL